MKRGKNTSGKLLDQFFARIPKPPAQDLANSRRQVRQHLGLSEARPVLISLEPAARIRFAVAAALALAIAAGGAMTYVVFHRSDLPIAQTVRGAIYRVSTKQPEVIPAGGRIASDDRIRANSDGAIVLSDGSQVEIRARSELSLESARDGVLIRLSLGGVIVNAAHQGNGHLYVETRDFTVSVVGTVFLVNAEAEGSQVAVIEGEVNVQQGEKQKKLRRGEQVATSPLMDTVPVTEEIAWSQNAREHLAMLQQAAPVPRVAAPENSTEAPQAFEVVSIKPATSPVSGARGGSPATSETALHLAQCGGPVELEPKRFAIHNTTAFRLIGLAYGMKNCLLVIDMGRVSGGPDWVKSAWFEIQAVIPDGSPVYTRPQLAFGEAPKLQIMIQSLLADRFKLELRREMKEVPAFNLVVVKPGRLKASENQDSLVRRTLTTPGGLEAINIDMSVLSSWFENAVGRPVLDKTELKGLFDIVPFDSNASGELDITYIAGQVLDQLGLKLEPTKVMADFLTIEHIEKPSAN